MSDEPNENPKLGQGLRRLANERLFVAPSKDEEMLNTIHQHFNTPTITTEISEATALFRPSRKAHRTPRRPTIWHKWLPLAASIAIAGLILYFSIPRKPQQADLNRDGIVDIVDALVLAEKLRDGEGRDINGDSSIDERDAAEIATRSVDLERSGS